MKFKILIKKLNNSLTKEETVIFSEWYESSKSHRDYFNALKNNYKNELDLVDVEKGWLSLHKKLKSKRTIKKIFSYGIAATIAIFLSIGYFVIEKHYNGKVEMALNNGQNHIFPGSDKAILTLADGANVTLEKGNTHVLNNASSNGSEIIYTNKKDASKKVVYNYLTIPRGGQFFVQLSDGTKVWLNSETKLKYPVNFVKDQVRVVELIYGEAYFDVSPSSEHNGVGFKVFQDDQEIDVVGTEFNIKAYKEEFNVYTTLVEGKVKVRHEGVYQHLRPGQQSNLDLKTNALEVETVDVYNEISWREGVFSFNNKNLKKIMTVLSRWYDIEVVFENKELEKEEFVGVLGKEQHITEILKSIQNFGIISDYQINEKTIILK